jgi:stearoyl-CoA 9-desaturase NADPH oxidoreductase
MPFLPSLSAVWRSPWLAPFNDVNALNDLLGQVNALWSIDRILARVIEVRTETADTRTFVLRTNRLWPGHRAGQHVVVEMEIDGVRRHRTFSIASAPGRSREIDITVRRQPHGRVTGWMHEQLRPGMVVGLSAPRGDFTLPETLPPRLLLIAAGSGITPIMAMLRDLQARGARPDIRLVQLSREPADAIFRNELEQLARGWPQLQLRTWYSRLQGRLDPRALDALVPDADQRSAWLCGPHVFMQAVLAHWQAQGRPAPQHESFGAPLRRAASGERVAVRALKAERMFTASADLPLLQEAESAGLQPKSGCRIGICQTCKCVKRSGVVRNLLTGAVSAEPDEQIQLCISAPVSELSLEL